MSDTEFVEDLLSKISYGEIECSKEQLNNLKEYQIGTVLHVVYQYNKLRFFTEVTSENIFEEF